jgi:hypothetical protein
MAPDDAIVPLVHARPTELFLRFPRGWAVELPAHARRMEASTAAWLRERGIIRDPSGAEKLEKLAVAEYANWPFATASPERALVITKFLALWIFYDDRIEERDDGRAAQVREAIAGRRSEAVELDPHVQCWWELGHACAQAMSAAWVERHASRFAQWVASVRVESLAAAVFRSTGVPPPVRDHLERRRLNIGMLPNLDFLEYQMGQELPADLHDDHDVVRISMLAADVVAIVNDLFGYAKDLRLRWPNLVSCMQHERRRGLADAFEAVVAMLDARVGQIVEIEHELRARGTHRSLLDRWLDGLHHVIYGFARWHGLAPRYRATHELEDGRGLRLVIA